MCHSVSVTTSGNEKIRTQTNESEAEPVATAGALDDAAAGAGSPQADWSYDQWFGPAEAGTAK